MTVIVYDWPVEWYDKITTQTYAPRSITQAASRARSGAQRISGPDAQFYVSRVTLAPMRDPERQDVGAFLARLKGRSGAMRLADSSKLAPWYDRSITPTRSNWSDGSTFTDGTGFVTGYLPPEVFVATAAARGANYIVLGGFPASTANVIRRGDPIQVKPNGDPGIFPHPYEAMFTCSSDASGLVGIEINPRLRQGVGVGDSVGLRYAASVFRLESDNEGETETADGGIGNIGFSLVEALDLVP